MVRRSILVVMIAASAVALPASALAATAPAEAPVLTSAPYAFPLTLHWTPAPDPLNLTQSVYRATGPCATPPAVGGLIITFPGNATTDFTGRPVDGTYCYHIRAADLATTADGPGVTVSVDTTDPDGDGRRLGRPGGCRQRHRRGLRHECGCGLWRRIERLARRRCRSLCLGPGARSDLGHDRSAPTAPTTSATWSTDNAGHIATADAP